ncbi:hypothetical protein MKW94_011065 [Papaver nudicaule]|uniref:60S acidic ribosomal protein P1 n=1 Tax=Papaver nudicaule TaxID=74823 RepID=A0AA41W0P4_PAPNU|nr:hypothetical protein [Papaver nudicaule]
MMILQDDAIAITADRIQTLVKTANVQCESYWPSLFAKLAASRNIEDLIFNAVAAGGGSAVAVSAPAGGGAGVAEQKKEEKVEEKIEEESDDEMPFSLFGEEDE